MPKLFRRSPEDAPIGDPAQTSRAEAPQRPQTLTLELLDWLIAALEAVMKTPQVADMADRRAVQSLRDALRYADHLYPHTAEARARTQPPADVTDSRVA